ncbi:MAG: hypothetical protein QXN36_07395 [Candidatus Bathyarchaeia archaeon]
MVEKRTIVFITLAITVWASITSGFAAYYYLEQMRYQKQAYEKQQLLTELTENYYTSITKLDLLSRDYNSLLEEYYHFGENLSLFVDKYKNLLSNMGNNYTLALNRFPKLNETYNNLLSRTLNGQSITREEFNSLLNDFYKLLTDLAAKELESFMDKISAIKVNLCIDYGNGTVEWHNISVPHGTTLFDLTHNMTEVTYTYYSWMEPGHILVNSINNVSAAPSEEKYWFWHYWDETNNRWISGQIGCDAWILKDNGTYKWEYKMWSP